MNALFSFIFRLLLVAVGLVVTASVAAVAALAGAVWLVRSGWLRLVGRSAAPLRKSVRPARTGRVPRTSHPDVTDVVAREPSRLL